MKRTAAPLTLATLAPALALGTNADYPLRDATWTWIDGEYHGATCRARETERYRLDVWSTEGILRVDEDLTQGRYAGTATNPTEDYGNLLETRLEAVYNTHTESSELSAELDEFYYTYHYNAAELQQHSNAEQLYLTFLRLYPEWTATAEVEYLSWYTHWCRDEDGDDKCDYITTSDGEELARILHQGPR